MKAKVLGAALVVLALLGVVAAAVLTVLPGPWTVRWVHRVALFELLLGGMAVIWAATKLRRPRQP